MSDDTEIHVELDLPQFDWPDNDPTKEAMHRAIDSWLGDFYSEHKRLPNGVEIAAACYVLGRKIANEPEA